MIKNTDGFNFNIEYIKEHTLDSEIVKDALSRSEYIPSDTEIFVDCKFAEPKCVQLGFCTEPKKQWCHKMPHITELKNTEK